MQHHPQPGFRTWAFTLAAAALFAVTLAVVGPALDAQTADVTPLPEGEVARMEAEARHLCATQRGDNAAIVQLPDGAVYCADKHGRRSGHSVITIAEKVSR
jgi:hypothetical protein